MRRQPGVLVAIGLIILVGIIFLGARYGPDILDQPSPQTENPQSPPTAEEPGDPEPPKSNPSSQIPEEIPETPTIPVELSNEKLSWYFIPKGGHQVAGIPDAARFISNYGGMYIGDTSRKVLYLTFDNGYENGYTTPILDALKNNQVRASFFVLESYINKNPDLVKRMVADGHDVCNHTATHPSMPEVSDSQIENEIRKTEKAFLKVTGTQMAKYFRPPSGEYSERTMALTERLGYSTVFWSMAYKDWDVNDQKGPDFAYNYVMQNVHPGAIILLHPVSSSNAQAMDRILKDLKAQGYEFSLLP